MQLIELKDVNIDLRSFAIDVVKYQNFKTKAAIDKLSGGLKENTKKNYFEAGITYIKRGEKRAGVSKKLFEYIDEARKNCVQPLRPSGEDKRTFYKSTYTQKNAIHPAQLALEAIKKESENAKMYVVITDSNAKIFYDKKDARLFYDGISFAGKKCKIGQVTIMEG